MLRIFSWLGYYLALLSLFYFFLWRHIYICSCCAPWFDLIWSDFHWTPHCLPRKFCCTRACLNQLPSSQSCPYFLVTPLEYFFLYRHLGFLYPVWERQADISNTIPNCFSIHYSQTLSLHWVLDSLCPFPQQEKQYPWASRDGRVLGSCLSMRCSVNPHTGDGFPTSNYTCCQFFACLFRLFFLVYFTLVVEFLIGKHSCSYKTESCKR